MDELLGLIISTVISFVISMIVWKFIYHLEKLKEDKEEEEEKNKIDNYTKAIDKLVDLLTNFQAFDLRMVLLHAYFPDCSIEDLYERVSDEDSYHDLLKEHLKDQLREVINNPALFLREKSGKAIQQEEEKKIMRC